jgi:hypothetical protein
MREKSFILIERDGITVFGVTWEKDRKIRQWLLRFDWLFSLIRRLL